MHLRSKILLILAGVVALDAVGAGVIQRAVVFPSFVELERKLAAQNLERVEEAIQGEVQHLDSFCYDWAAWDDTYQFVEQPNDEYIAGNLGPSSFENGNFDLLFLVDRHCDVVWGECHDPADAARQFELPSFPHGRWPKGHPLLMSVGERESVHGLQLTGQGPMLVSARPVVNSLKDQPMRGWLIMGRFMTPKRLRALAEQTRVEFRARTTSGELDRDDARALERLRAGEARILEPRDEHLLQTYALLPDIEHEQGLLLRADVQRTVTAEGRDALQFASLNTIGASLLLLFVLYLLLQRTVVGPLASLTRQAVRIGQGDDVPAKLLSQRSDEIGVLSREFGHMVERLASSRSELLETARLGGMSEIATGVLHNVGNVLNSVNVSASLAARKADSANLADLERVSEILASRAQELSSWLATDPRGQRLPGFLVALTRELVQERGELQEELRSVATGIDHIKALVDAQQEYAGNSGVLEPIALRELVETALKISRAAGGDEGIEVVREYAELPPLLLHKHKVLLVLVNLIRNARQALLESGRGEPRLTIRLARSGDRARIEIQDNGAGIAPENRERIFRHGFTTKRDGHGFGLHASANAAREMNGNLTGASEGLGRGATFTLELPWKEAQPV
jgi:two-component system, NtrC family, sensor kinase